jgi:hypothetical protein
MYVDSLQFGIRLESNRKQEMWLKVSKNKNTIFHLLLTLFSLAHSLIHMFMLSCSYNAEAHFQFTNVIFISITAYNSPTQITEINEKQQ